jgi:hypothetical protein
MSSHLLGPARGLCGALSAVLVSLVLAAPALAGQASGSLQVMVRVVEPCEVTLMPKGDDAVVVQASCPMQSDGGAIESPDAAMPQAVTEDGVGEGARAITVVF